MPRLLGRQSNAGTSYLLLSPHQGASALPGIWLAWPHTNFPNSLRHRIPTPTDQETKVTEQVNYIKIATLTNSKYVLFAQWPRSSTAQSVWDSKSLTISTISCWFWMQEAKNHFPEPLKSKKFFLQPRKLFLLDSPVSNNVQGLSSVRVPFKDSHTPKLPWPWVSRPNSLFFLTLPGPYLREHLWNPFQI